jgi:hypothetical protein
MVAHFFSTEPLSTPHHKTPQRSFVLFLQPSSFAISFCSGVDITIVLASIGVKESDEVRVNEWVFEGVWMEEEEDDVVVD